MSFATSRTPGPRRLLGGLAAALALASASALAADDYPNRQVRIVVPFAPGGSADVFGRFVAQKLGDSLGQNFIVENKPGAGSVIGSDAVAKSAPDGYTLLLMSNTHTVNESLLTKKPFMLMRDFEPIAPLSYSDLVLVAKNDLAASTVQELVKAAKADPSKFSYASSGPGTPYHMAGELFKVMAGVSILHVPYKGSAGARTDVLGGQVDMMFDAIPTMSENVKAGKVKALATSGKTRSPILPDVPTVAESGVPGYESTIWLGVVAPKGTPAAIVSKLNAEIAKITGNAEVRKQWATQGTTAMTMSAPEFTDYLNADIKKWAEIVKVSGAKVD